MERLVKIASLFSGCWGSDLWVMGGFTFLWKKYKKLKTKIVFANDIDTPAVETYKVNFWDHIINKSIVEIESEIIPEHDILIWWFPCQTFSIVWNRQWLNDPRWQLFLEMARILKDKQPKAFIAENVKWLTNIQKWEIFKLILNTFEKTGYNISYKVVNAVDFWVPQKRQRVFIIWIRKDIGKTFIFPEIKENPIPLSAVIDDNSTIPEKYYFSNRAVEWMKNANKSFNKWRAQDISQPCNTISSHLAKVSLNWTDPVLLVWNDRYRRFTPLEASRIQSFPDTFKFAWSDANAYKQIWNAIAPVVIWHIAKELIDQMKNNDINLWKQS